MEQLSTMVMKLEHEERRKSPLTDMPNVEVVLQHLQAHYPRAARYGS
jgi:hypothetical protein